jgi:2-methylaconitate isomerase
VRAAAFSDAQVAEIRAAGAVRAGMIARLADAHTTPAVPRVALVAPPDDDQPDNDVRVSMYSMGRLHASLPLTGAIATAVAARITGSVVHSAARAHDGGIRLRHPGGVQLIEAAVERVDGTWHVERASTTRTARRLMSGLLEVPPPRKGEP